MLKDFQSESDHEKSAPASYHLCSNLQAYRSRKTSSGVGKSINIEHHFAQSHARIMKDYFWPPTSHQTVLGTLTLYITHLNLSEGFGF